MTPGKAGLRGTGGAPADAVAGGVGTGEVGLTAFGPLPERGTDPEVSSTGRGEVYFGAVGFMNALAISNAKPSGTAVGETGGGGGGISSSGGGGGGKAGSTALALLGGFFEAASGGR